MQGIVARIKGRAVRPPPLLDLVEESFDEAEFLWKSWERALLSHARDLDGVVFWVEERLFGSLDGVRAGGEFAYEQLILPALSDENALRATVGAYLLATTPNAASLEALLLALSKADPTQLPCFRRAIELGGSPEMIEQIYRALYTGSPEQRALCLDLCEFQRHEALQVAQQASMDAEPVLACAGLRVLRNSPPEVVRGLVCAQLGSDRAGVAGAAMETGLVLGALEAWACCREFGRRGGPGSDRALLLLAALGGEEEQRSVIAALGDEARRAAALFALGFAGTRAAADACAKLLESEDTAQLAAEALSAITGLDLEQAQMLVREPEHPAEPVPFEQDDLDADLVPTPEQLLPRPDGPRLRKWWEQERVRFVPGQRYIGGRPLNLDELQNALERGPMRRRFAVALEVAVRSQGGYQPQTAAFCTTQKLQLQRFAALGGVKMQRSPLSRFFSPA